MGKWAFLLLLAGIKIGTTFLEGDMYQIWQYT